MFDQTAHGFPVAPTLACLPPKGMLTTDTQKIMPAAILAQLHQRKASEATISHQGTIRFCSYARLHQVEQPCHDTPLSFFPFLLSWHHRPGDWQHTRMHEQAQIHDRCIVSEWRTIEH